MKFRFTFLLLILLFFSVLVPVTTTKAQDVDYVAAAVAGLQTSNVYVHPNAEGTNFDTANELSTYVTSNSQVVLVVLPFDALKNSDINKLARDISFGLNNQKTIGLAIGPNLVGYSAVLPEGTASSMMERAKSVSNSPITALIAFSQSAQLWYDSNPQPTPSPTPAPTDTPRPTMEPIELPKAKDIGWPIWTCSAIFLILFFAFLTKIVRNGIQRAKEEEKRQQRYGGLEKFRQKIQAIEIDVDQILDRKIKKDLQGAVLLAYGQIDMLEEHSSYIGMTESLTPEMINNMGKQVKALLRHESGRRPMSEQLYEDLTEALINYDALFKTLQADDPEGAELLASVIHTKTTIISRNGYLE